MVRYSARELAPVIEKLGGKKPDLVPGYRVKIFDGNALGGTEHRRSVLRNTSAGALPGKSLVVLDPAQMLAIDLFPTEDGHAQERSLLKEVLKTVEANDLWIADRNMCVLAFLLGIAQRQAAFVIREHASRLLTLCVFGRFSEKLFVLFFVAGKAAVPVAFPQKQSTHFLHEVLWAKGFRVNSLACLPAPAVSFSSTSNRRGRDGGSLGADRPPRTGSSTVTSASGGGAIKSTDS